MRFTLGITNLENKEESVQYLNCGFVIYCPSNNMYCIWNASIVMFYKLKGGDHVANLDYSNKIG